MSLSWETSNFADNVNYRFTPVLCSTIGFSLLALTVIQSPLQCKPPDEASSDFGQYIEAKCWLSDTYYLPQTQDQTAQEETMKLNLNQSHVKFVPLIFFAIAITFKLPHWFWLLFADQSKTKLTEIEDFSENCKSLDHETETTRCSAWYNRYHVLRSIFLFIIYLISKILYGVLITQWFSHVGKCLQLDYDDYGYVIKEALLENNKLIASPMFPREIICVIELHPYGNIVRYTLPCVHSINFYNELAFMILWIWLSAIFIMTWADFAMWLCRAFMGNISVFTQKITRTEMASEEEHAMRILGVEHSFDVHSFVKEILDMMDDDI